MSEITNRYQSLNQIVHVNCANGIGNYIYLLISRQHAASKSICCLCELGLIQILCQQNDPSPHRISLSIESISISIYHLCSVSLSSGFFVAFLFLFFTSIVVRINILYKWDAFSLISFVISKRMHSIERTISARSFTLHTLSYTQ